MRYKVGDACPKCGRRIDYLFTRKVGKRKYLVAQHKLPNGKYKQCSLGPVEESEGGSEIDLLLKLFARVERKLHAVLLCAPLLWIPKLAWEKRQAKNTIYYVRWFELGEDVRAEVRVFRNLKICARFSGRPLSLEELKVFAEELKEKLGEYGLMVGDWRIRDCEITAFLSRNLSEIIRYVKMYRHPGEQNYRLEARIANISVSLDKLQDDLELFSAPPRPRRQRRVRSDPPVVGSGRITLSQAEGQVRKFLAERRGGEASIKEIAEATGLGVFTVAVILYRLAKAGLIDLADDEKAEADLEPARALLDQIVGRLEEEHEVWLQSFQNL